MIERRRETIPVDSLEIRRKVMTGSRSTLQGEVRAAVREADLKALPGVIREHEQIAVSLVDQHEYAEEKLKHPLLAAYSIAGLAESFNARLNRQKGRLNDYANSVLGEAFYDNVEEGSFVVGFMMSEGFRKRIARERTESIDTLLDEAGLPLTDPFRQWRNEEPDADFWLPVLQISSADPGAEAALDDFTDHLTDRAATVEIDFYDVQARQRTVDLPTSILMTQPE